MFLGAQGAAAVEEPLPRRRLKTALAEAAVVPANRYSVSLTLLLLVSRFPSPLAQEDQVEQQGLLVAMAAVRSLAHWQPSLAAEGAKSALHKPAPLQALLVALDIRLVAILVIVVLQSEVMPEPVAALYSDLQRLLSGMQWVRRCQESMPRVSAVAGPGPGEQTEALEAAPGPQAATAPPVC